MSEITCYSCGRTFIPDEGWSHCPFCGMGLPIVYDSDTIFWAILIDWHQWTDEETGQPIYNLEVFRTKKDALEYAKQQNGPTLLISYRFVDEDESGRIKPLTYQEVLDGVVGKDQADQVVRYIATTGLEKTGGPEGLE